MRATACFSMYSDMSSRTSARSPSNRNSASARAVSVLPTPVGPRKMNEPVGRLGSWSPARARRAAFAHAARAPPPRRLRLAAARGTEEDERAGGAIGILEPRARAAHGVRHRRQRLALADHALAQLLLELEQPLLLRLHHLRHRDAGPLRHDPLDVVVVDFFFEILALLLDLGEA